MKIFYFTTSGNSLAVAKAFKAELISIPKVLQDNTTEFEDNQIGIIFPCYCGGVPTLVEKFLATVTLKAEYLFGIITYGKMCLGAEKQLENLAQQNGFELSYTNKIIMVDNSLKYFDMNEQIEEQAQKNIEFHTRKIVQEITNQKSKKATSNIAIKAISRLQKHLYLKEIGDYDKKFSIEDTCNNCGTCRVVCPVGNIELSTKPHFLHNCIRCYACTHNCPRNAIRLAGEKSTARFRNDNITLAEVIASNNQHNLP